MLCTFKVYSVMTLCMYIPCEMFTTGLVNTSFTSYNHLSGIVIMVKIFKIYSQSNLQVYNTLLWTIVPTLYAVSPELLFITGDLYPLTNISPFPPVPQPLATTTLLFVSMTLDILDSTCKGNYTVFFSCLILALIPSRSSHVFPMAGFPSFFHG